MARYRLQYPHPLQSNLFFDRLLSDNQYYEEGTGVVTLFQPQKKLPKHFTSVDAVKTLDLYLTFETTLLLNIQILTGMYI